MNDILQIFDELAAQPKTESSRLLECEMEDKESELMQKYQDLVAEITKAFGKPDYSGRGPDGGVEVQRLRDVSQRVQFSYTSMIEVSFWERQNKIFLVTLTGHDANTLLCLTATTLNLDKNLPDPKTFAQEQLAQARGRQGQAP